MATTAFVADSVTAFQARWKASAIGWPMLVLNHEPIAEKTPTMPLYTAAAPAVTAVHAAVNASVSG